jgi:beta-lactamase regulating signal transducer with metallopeptidase domain
MNELGMTLAWSAAQVTLVIVPAAILHVLASRRSAATGAWVAAVGLLLCAAISIATVTQRPTIKDSSHATRAAALINTNQDATPNAAGRNAPSARAETRRHDAALALSFGRMREYFKRLERRAASPVERIRTWGSVLAVVGILGSGAGLLRLLLGVLAVRLCRRRGTIVDDPRWIELLDEVRAAIGCRQHVELREVPALLTPATAGWRRPVIMLPDDWRSWNDVDRRAVVAHELAHIKRRDYAMGVASQVALALNFYHPLVHWMAARLLLQQEFAADLLGARFAGGRDSYLSALSRMALKQDARSPYWLARAFLPARGTLLRRIAMLQRKSVTVDRPWSGPRRLLAGLCLLAIAAIALVLRGPVRAAENDDVARSSRAAVPANLTDETTTAAPFDLRFLSDDTVGVVAFHPAATFRRTGMRRFSKLISEAAVLAFRDDTKLVVDLSVPGRPSFSLDDIESIIVGIRFGRTKTPKNSEAPNLHTLAFERPTIRTTAPFDWLRFLRQWHCEFREVADGGHVYYKIVGLMKPLMGLNPCVYLPDDRTIVFEEEAAIQELVRRQKPFVPALIAGPEWDRVSRGLLAVAICNQGGAFAKDYDLGRPDDAVVVSLFKDVDRWVAGADDADAIMLRAAAACRGDASKAVAGTVESLLKSQRDAMTKSRKPDPTGVDFENRLGVLVRLLLTNLRVDRDDRSVALSARGLGTLAEFSSLVEEGFKEKAIQFDD